jgi:hypothetical protein
MTRALKKRIAFRPSINDRQLEDRIVLSSIPTTNATALIVDLTPDVTPRPAPSPVSVRALMTSLHRAYSIELQDARNDLRKTIDADIKHLYAGGPKPTAQARADFIAEVDGAVDATALRVSSPASLLPGADTSLVPTLQNDLLGNGTGSLISRLNAVSQTARDIFSAGSLTNALNQAVNSSSARILAATQSYISTAPLAQSIVATTGQLVPLRDYMATEVIDQLENNLGLLAQEFPTVANAILFPSSTTSGSTNPTSTGTTGTTTTTTGTTGTTGTTTPTGTTPTLNQTLMSQLGTDVNNALATIAFELGTELPLFSGSSSVISTLDSALFGASNGSAATASNTASSLASALANLQYGGSSLNTGVSNAFTSALDNLVSPLYTFLDITSPANLSLQTGNFSNPFASGYASPSFNAGFNNGFVTTSGANSVGLVGFGVTPALSTSTYNTNFGTGFSNLVNLVDTSAGFPSSGSSLLSLGTTSTGQTSLTNTGTTGTTTGLTTVGTNSPGQTTTVATSTS